MKLDKTTLDKLWGPIIKAAQSVHVEGMDLPDKVQEILLRLLTARPRHKRALKPWTFRVGRNHLLNLDKKPRLPTVELAEAPPQEHWPNQDRADSLDLDAFMLSLPVPYYALLQWYRGGMTWKDAARLYKSTFPGEPSFFTARYRHIPRLAQEFLVESGFAAKPAAV
jgi:DNA-directed RNA polymerase specialized sigma24 family protein